MTWWNVRGEWVLELDNWPLELHWRLVGGRSVAFWLDDEGRWVGAVRAGSA